MVQLQVMQQLQWEVMILQLQLVVQLLVQILVSQELEQLNIVQVQIVQTLYLILLEIVLTVILLGYMGKCYVWIYIHLCNYDEPAWFGWDQFRYIVAEAAGGALATMVLMGCCVKD